MLECELKVIMVKKNIKQTELSRRTGVSREVINRIANGKIEDPSLETALLIAKALDASVEYIWQIKETT